MIAAAIERVAAAAIGVVVMVGVAWTVDVRATQASSPPAIVSTLESPSRAVFKYRVAIASLLELKPGMVAADVGAGSGFITRLLASQVSPNGRVIATDRDPALVSYIEEKAKADGLQNVSARLAPADGTGLEPATADAVVAVEVLGRDRHAADLIKALASALKPGGIMVVVDSAREGQGDQQTGIDADDVIAMATAAGVTRIDEIGIVPGHFALRFRKP
jgi:cyclopropane fatty-acyl-phospholipid synthase-like methyltransferase